MSIRVFIGVGHGGSDSGANSYVREKDANLTIALEMQKQLEAAGLVVGMSRTVDENDTIYEEIREANEFAPDLAVEVHNNAGGGDGFEVFVQTNKYATQSKACAQAIEAEVKAIGQNSRGIKDKTYGWTYSVKAPAVLLEGFFVDHKADAAAFDTVAEQQELGRAYARGILKYLGVEEKPADSQSNSVDTYIVTASGTKEYVAKYDADNAVANINKLGFIGTITNKPAVVKQIEKGSTVRLKQGAKYHDGKTPKSFVYNRDHKVSKVNGDRVTITYLGIAIGIVYKKDLILVE